jgi:serine/threonine protein kinase
MDSNRKPSLEIERRRPGGPETLPARTVVGEFEIAGVLGQGGFATVYLAIDHSLQRNVALKEYMPSALAMRKGDRSVVARSRQLADAFEVGRRSFIN